MDRSSRRDQRKAKANEGKHGIAFVGAITVSSDPLAHIFDDPDHSGAEDRRSLSGESRARNGY